MKKVKNMKEEEKNIKESLRCKKEKDMKKKKKRKIGDDDDDDESYYIRMKKKRKIDKEKDELNGEKASFNNSQSSMLDFQSSSKESSNKEDLNESILSNDYDDKIISNVNMSVGELMEAKRAQRKDSKINRMLLELALKESKHTNESYEIEWTKMNFEKIAENIEGMTAKSCKKKIKGLLLARKYRFKCLYQVLQEAVINITHPIHKTVWHPQMYNNFVAKNAEKIDEVVRNNMGRDSQSIAAADMWKNLTREEKKSYRVSVGAERGSSAFDVYRESKKDESVNLTTLLREWRNFEIKDKIIFIKRSAEIMMNITENRENGEQVDRGSIRGPSEKEVVQLLNYTAIPSKPSHLVQIYYVKESGEVKEQLSNILAEAIRRFSLLDDKKKIYWITKHQKESRDFDKNLQRWKDCQDAVTLYLYQFYMEFNEKYKAKKAASRAKPTKPVRELVAIEMDIGKTVFKGEPSIPPLSILRVYNDEIEKKTGKPHSLPESRKKMKNISKFEKATLQFKVDKIRDTYINQLKNFVNSLSKDHKKVFLGVKRVYYINLLDQDIFEEEYPNNIYPVYMKPGSSRTPIKNIYLSIREEQPKAQTAAKKRAVIEEGKPESLAPRKETLKKLKKVTSPEKGKLKAKDKKKRTEIDSDEFLSAEIEDTNDIEVLKASPKQQKESNAKWEGLLFSDDDTTLDESVPVASKSPLKKQTTNKFLHSTGIKMESDSDDDSMKGDSIQAYMNFLTFRKDITKDESSDDE